MSAHDKEDGVDQAELARRSRTAAALANGLALWHNMGVILRLRHKHRGSICLYLTLLAGPAWVASLAAPALARTCVHVVLPGDTLRSVARDYHSQMGAIRRANKLRGTIIRVGTRLRVPRARGCRGERISTHRVRKGESLTAIGKRFGMSVRQLEALNPRLKEGVLRPDARVRVVASGTRSSASGGRRRYDLVQLGQGTGYMRRDASKSWGTELTVRRLQQGFAAYAEHFPTHSELEVHDLSREHGGRMPPHASHHSGRDVDIVYPRTEDGVDYEAVSFFFSALCRTGDVQYIFMHRTLMRALGRWENAHLEGSVGLGGCDEGVIRHARGHRDHFHIRFGTGAEEVGKGESSSVDRTQSDD